MKRVMKASGIFLVFLLCMATSLPAQQKLPTKPVEAAVAWAAGGGADLVFRTMAAVFPNCANGQPLVIKNVPGAPLILGPMAEDNLNRARLVSGNDWSILVQRPISLVFLILALISIVVPLYTAYRDQKRAAAGAKAK